MLRRVAREAVSVRLEEWGDQREAADPAKRRSLRQLERDFAQVLVELAEEFPLLASLVERKAGGQKRLPIGTPNGSEEGRSFVTASVTAQAESEADVSGEQPPASDRKPGAPEESESPQVNSRLPGDISLPGKPSRSRPMKYGLHIRFESHPDDPELGRLIESAVVVNQGHPAYRRAIASRSEGYHIALCVALALARLAAEPKETQAFVTTFLSRWGEALDGTHRSSRKRP